MTARAVALPAPNGSPILDRGVSDAARRLRELWSDAAGFSGTVSIAEPRLRAREALDTTFVEASQPNWDGEGALPAHPLSYAYTRAFIEALPASTPTPEVLVDPDGELCLEWDMGPLSVFSVSIGRDGTLTYAGLFGASKSHGVEPFADFVPLAVAVGIERATARG